MEEAALRHPVLATLALLAACDNAAAQSPAPAGALDLVVGLVSFLPDGPEFGAGIIVGRRGDTLFITTAKHVVVQAGRTPDSLLVTFRDSTRARATVRDTAGGTFDLAVIVIPSGRRLPVPALDRLGDPRLLRFGDPVRAVGCPAERCWRLPGEPDAIMATEGGKIGFQSSFVQPGSSGGALFNNYWEVVGIVIQDEPPRVDAISIDEVMAALRVWSVPTGLRRAEIPRAGYRQSLSAALFGLRNQPLSGVPAGRATYTRRMGGRFFAQAGLMRILDTNLAVDGVTAGIGFVARSGRFAARPFVELAMLRVQGRYDTGGYYATTPSGTRYVPVWEHVSSSGMGAGAGLTIEYVISPPFMIEATAGRWSYTPPSQLANTGSNAIGIGLRWGHR